MSKQHKKDLLFSNLSPKQQQSCLSQIHSDIADRSLPGTFIYMLVWFCIAFLVTQDTDDAVFIGWIHSVSILMTLSAIFRVAMIVISKSYLDKPTICRSILIIGLAVSSLSWGLMAACAFLDTPLAYKQDLIFLSTVGLCGGGAISFTASRLFTWLFLICMLTPIAFVELVMLANTNLETIFIIVVYSIGLISATKIPNREYKSALISNLQLEEISNTDALTGVRNRRYFDMQLNEEVKRAQRCQYPLSLILVDIDHFKKINDEFGHPVGDQCLIAVAKRLSLSMNRVSDTVARYGGEEFAIILPNMSAEKCTEFAEKIRADIASSPFNFEDNSHAITASFGCHTQYRLEKGLNPSALIHKADQALYQAKANGRNRVQASH